MEAGHAAIPAAVTDRLLHFRYVVVLVVALAAAVVAGGHGDWNQFVIAGRDMFQSDGLRVYLHHSDTQTGPLSLALARVLALTPRDGFVLAALLSMALGVSSIVLVEEGAHLVGVERRTRQFLTLVGGSVLMFTWGKLGGYGHLDDAIVLFCGVASTRQALSRRPWVVAVLLVVAIAAKPWAVILFPLLLVEVVRSRPSWWRTLLPAAFAGALVAAVWLPFLLSSPGISHAIRPTVEVAPDSVLVPLGLSQGQLPDWLRIAQFVVAFVVGMVLVLRRRYLGMLLAAIAVRLATDPATWSYYTPGLVAGALLWDQMLGDRAVPWATLGAVALLAPAWVMPDPQVRAIMRLVAAVGAVALAAMGPESPAMTMQPFMDEPADEPPTPLAPQQLPL